MCVCGWIDPTEAFVGKGVLGTVKTLLECSCFANLSLIIFVLEESNLISLYKNQEHYSCGN